MVRHYTDEPLSPEVVERVLAEGGDQPRAPSARHRHSRGDGSGRRSGSPPFVARDRTRRRRHPGSGEPARRPWR
ncbi:MAG: hypothetical protein LH469_06670 [Frankiaceae bacterium]|nr:hypothetical protein [Frankiaceae bacterium]